MTEQIPRGIIPRRNDRSKDVEWIREYLTRATWGVIAVDAGAGKPPHLNSNIFLYLPGPDRIYLHTARTGATPDALAAPQACAFSSGGMGRILPAPEALEFSVEYNGVSATGTGYTVTDKAEAEEALEILLDKYAPHLESGVDYHPPTVEEMKRTAVFRMDIEAWAGKEKLAGEHPKSFRIDPMPVPLRAVDLPKVDTE